MIKSGRLTRNVMKFVKWMEDGKQTRSLSWVHCRQAFLYRRALSDQELALHLAFFLASWGMYRPTSFLLQKDFMVHLPAVSILKSPKFNPLWHMPVDRAHEDAMLKLTLKLGDDIRTAYLPDHASDTLVTKVLLGTICCTPAFDKFARIGLQKWQMVQQFSERGMRGIYSLYQYRFSWVHSAMGAALSVFHAYMNFITASRGCRVG